MSCSLPARIRVHRGRTARGVLHAFVAVLLAAVLGACRLPGEPVPEPAPPLMLTIESAAWSGWGGENQPDAHSQRERAQLGTQILLGTLVGDMTIEITDVTRDSVTFTTSEPMAPRSGDGTNLNDLQQDFTVRTGSPVEFATPTMDAGTIVTVRLTEA